MKWRGRKSSANIEDRRRTGGSGKRKAGGIGLVGTIVIAVVMMYFNQDPSQVLEMANGGMQSSGGQVSNNYQESAQDKELSQFIGVALQDTEDVWNKLFRENNWGNYPEPKLVLFH